MSVHVIDQGADAPTSAAAGDIVIRKAGENVELARVTDGGAEWLGAVPADQLDLEAEGQELEIAARGLETALANRGG